MKVSQYDFFGTICGIASTLAMKQVLYQRRVRNISSKFNTIHIRSIQILFESYRTYNIPCMSIEILYKYRYRIFYDAHKEFYMRIYNNTCMKCVTRDTPTIFGDVSSP